MKHLKTLVLKLLFTAFYALAVFYAGQSYAAKPAGLPVKYLSSCEADFNGDGRIDLAILVESADGLKLIMHLAQPDSKIYQTHVITKNIAPKMLMGCEESRRLKETSEGTESWSRSFDPKGAVLKFTKLGAIGRSPSSQLALFWDGQSFRSIWLAP